MGPGGGTNAVPPVVLQLADRLVDVGQRAVGQALVRLAEVDPRVPAPAQLLDRAHVDHPVVQEVVQRRHVAGDEATVGADRVTGQRRCVGLLDVPADVVEHRRLGGREVDGRRTHLVGQPRAVVHLGDDRQHSGQRRRRRHELPRRRRRRGCSDRHRSPERRSRSTCPS